MLLQAGGIIEFPLAKAKMGRRLMDGWGDEVIGVVGKCGGSVDGL